MSQRRLALMGAKEGPWTSAQGIARPQLEVRGLKAGKIDAIARLVSGEHIIVVAEADGTYPLPTPLDWLKISCSEPTGVVCQLVAGRAA